ncbi:YiiX/YebB-like N1pC/P60 family cysteine hydrolase [uncultured Sphingomonas sp.]|uniref:YiiX/YebB-like N1pC/P60 family cysteine hydrolase n=1 Tax=uncultured Sphingomonas sp. TaxID=158754 RepID=UPI0035CC083F
MSVPASALTDLPSQDYAALRNMVQTGDIALASGSALFSRAIRIATASPWSHVAIIVKIAGFDSAMVMEAVEKVGVRMVPLSRFVLEDSSHHRPFPGDIVIARHDRFAELATPERIDAMIEFAIDRLGSPFQASEMAKIGLRVAAGWFGVMMPRALESDDEFICSEYVARCYDHVGITIPWNHHGFIAPADFAGDPHIQAVARVSRTPFPAT